MTIANATSMAIKDLTHTPQGDDNRPSVLSNVLHYIENQLTPRKGTETPKRPRTCSGQDDLTHTPQGDGSQLNADPVGLVVAANQLTPRKGT